MSAVATLDQLASIRGPQLCVFVGVSTAGSRVHTVFPAWSPLLLPDTELVGLDLPVTTDAETYRRVIRVLVGNPRIRVRCRHDPQAAPVRRRGFEPRSDRYYGLVEHPVP